jgi:hypothetical protein
MRTWLAVVLLLFGFGGVARAQEPACFAPPKTFDGARPIAAARTLGGEPHPALTLAEPAHLALVEARKLILISPPGKPVGEADKGGLVRLHIAMSGTYRIALGGKAWIDVVAKGRSLESVAHSHGAPCSGIAKQVDFTLAPGDYTIQLTEAQTDTLDMLVTLLSSSSQT